MRDKTAMVLQGGSGLHVINDGRLLRRNGLAENFPEGISYPMKLSPEATNYNTCTFIVNGDQWADSAYNMEYWMLQNGLDIRFFEFDGNFTRLFIKCARQLVENKNRICNVFSTFYSHFETQHIFHVFTERQL